MLACYIFVHQLVNLKRVCMFAFSHASRMQICTSQLLLFAHFTKSHFLIFQKILKNPSCSTLTVFLEASNWNSNMYSCAFHRPRRYHIVNFRFHRVYIAWWLHRWCFNEYVRFNLRFQIKKSVSIWLACDMKWRKNILWKIFTTPDWSERWEESTRDKVCVYMRRHKLHFCIL